MSKKFLIHDETHFYHKLLCFQLAKDLDDSFAAIKALPDDSRIAKEYVPPHELKEILRREIEERERKELEEAEMKRNIEIERVQNRFID